MEWSNLEALHLVEQELKYTGRFINQDLTKYFPHRSATDIKNRRRTAAHKSLFEQVRRDRDEALQNHDELLLSPPPHEISAINPQEPTSSESSEYESHAESPLSNVFQQAQFECTACGQNFKLRSSLLRHQKQSCLRDTSCPICSEEFSTFSGMRLHMRKSHSEEYFDEVEASATVEPTAIYQKLAAAEVLAPPNVNMSLYLINSTGLSANVIKYRRRQQIYKEYLVQATNSSNRQVLADSTLPTSSEIPPSTPASPENSNIAAVIITEADIHTHYTESRVSPKKDSPMRIPVVLERNMDLDLDRISIVHEDIASEVSPSPDLERGLESNENNLLWEIDELNNQNENSVDEKLKNAYHKITLQSDISLPTCLVPCLETLVESAADTLSKNSLLIKAARSALEGNYSIFASQIESWISTRFSPKISRTVDPPSKRLDNCTVSGTTTNKRRNNRSSRRESEYKKAQDLFRKNRKGLADVILSNRPLNGANINPPYRAFGELFRTSIETTSQADNAPFLTVEISESSKLSLTSLITPDDVTRGKLGWKRSAPGLDGISVAKVMSTCNTELSLLFSLLLATSYQPEKWKTLRSVMVPKKGPPSLASSWRPITIGSAIQRLMHRILNLKMSESLQLHLSQRGFVRVDGTLANSILLDYYIRSRADACVPYNVVSLDLSQAFDHLSHHSISRALQRFQVPEFLQRYIIATYDATTILKMGNFCSEPIKIARGVRQGDPLSPLIFNLVLDELLVSCDILDKCSAGGIEIAPVIAFADDIVLMGDDLTTTQATLDHVSSFLRDRGLTINPAKCHSISVKVCNRRLCPSNKSVFSLEDIPLPCVSNINSFNYLGHEISNFGVLKPNINNLPKWLDCLLRAPLKPDQKLHLLKQNVIPKLYHGLQNTKLNIGVLKEADLQIRRFVKAVVHLHSHTLDVVIHARVREGGLGILSLVSVIPRSFSRRLENIANSDDPIIREILSTARLRAIRDRFLRLSNNPNPGEFISQHPFSRGLQQCCQDSSSNTWIFNKPFGWTGRDYVRGIQLRTSNLPTVGIPSNPPDARRCRHGCGVDETICHVLQACPKTQDIRILRHNHIVRKLKDHCNFKRFTVEVEPHIRHKDGRLDKPDLAVHITDDRLVICDVQISWDSNNLSDAWSSKKSRYNTPGFIEAAAKHWPGKSVSFAPLIIGARGIWPSSNRVTESLLDIPPFFKRSCVSGVIKWGSSIHNMFMSSLRDRDPGRYRRRCL